MTERKAFIDRNAELAVTRQCALLGVARSSAYYQPIPVSEATLALTRRIDEIHTMRPFLGSRGIVNALLNDDLIVNRKRVQRLMVLMGILALYQKPRTSRPGVGAGHTIYPYLLGGAMVVRANQIWVSDITFIPMAAGFAYLVAIMDLYSRKILTWRVSNTLDARFCVDALQDALARFGTPEIFNTDQGAQFTSTAFTRILDEHGIRISMDGKGRWVDNVFIERFWRSIKYEEVYLHAYETVRDARTGVASYIVYYNRERRHASLDRLTPDEAYNQSVTRELMRATPNSGAVTSRPCS